MPASLPWKVWAGLSLALALFVVFSPATYDSGDALQHYLYPRWVFQHPEHLLNHWAKPLFVLLAAPFAQLGLWGVKLFNALCAAGAVGFVLDAARRQGLKNLALLPVFAFFATEFAQIANSALTEPLFGLGLAFAFRAWARGRFGWCALVVGLLPYVRSEGLIYQLLLGVLLLVYGQWRMLPLLLAGHLVYAMAGALFLPPEEGGFLWYFTENPYNGSAQAVYGTGEWLHFIRSLVNVLGVPVLALFGLGHFVLAPRIWKQLRSKQLPKPFFDVWVLPLLLFWALVGAHTWFWAMGGFNSFGMIRVLMPVIPFGALIALHGFNGVSEILSEHRKWPLAARIWRWLAMAYIVVFPFTSNPAAWSSYKTLRPDPAADAIAHALAHARQLGWPAQGRSLSYCAPLAAYLSGEDPDSPLSHQQRCRTDPFPHINFLLVDPWFSSTECGIQADSLLASGRYAEEGRWEYANSKGETQTVFLLKRVGR